MQGLMVVGIIVDEILRVGLKDDKVGHRGEAICKV